MSSYLNCISTTTYEDFILPHIINNKEIQQKAHIIMKVTVIVVGFIVIGMVFVIERMGTVIQLAVSFAGVCSGATLGVFSIGMIFPWANAKGALTGAIAGLMFMAWIVTGALVTGGAGEARFPFLPTSTDGCYEMFNMTVLPSTMSPPPVPDGFGDNAFFLYKISYMYYTMVGSIVVLVVGMSVSYFTGFTKPSDVESRLLVPFMQKYGSSYSDPTEKELLNMQNGNGKLLKEEKTYDFSETT